MSKETKKTKDTQNTAATEGPTYLVCVNDAEYSKIALKYACQLVRRKNGNMLVLHVTEPADFQSLGAVADKIKAEQKQKARALLSQLAGEIETKAKLMHREGIISESIMQVVEDNHKIDMLILGCAADGSKSKTSIPIVSELGHKLLIPMLIVPGNLTDQQIEFIA